MASKQDEDDVAANADDDAQDIATEDDKDDVDADEAVDDKDDADDKTPAEPDWKKMARRHEREAKAARKREADLQAKLKQREDADKTEQEKAIEQARTEAETTVAAKYEAQQRADRIENAVTRLSLKGFKTKGSDGKEVTLRFADPDDAQLRLDRALRDDDLTYDEIYADGKVQTSSLVKFMTELLEEHPRLRAQENGGIPERVVDMDGGKGKGGGHKSLADMSPEDHYQALRGKS